MTGSEKNGRWLLYCVINISVAKLFGNVLHQGIHPRTEAFYGKRRIRLEVNMANTRQGGRKKESRKGRTRKKSNIKITGVEGDEELEVTVRHGTVSGEKPISIWGWHEEFTAAWSETFITKKRRSSRKGE